MTPTPPWLICYSKWLGRPRVKIDVVTSNYYNVLQLSGFGFSLDSIW